MVIRNIDKFLQNTPSPWLFDFNLPHHCVSFQQQKSFINKVSLYKLGLQEEVVERRVTKRNY
jgi:hypothetical protein